MMRSLVIPVIILSMVWGAVSCGKDNSADAVVKKAPGAIASIRQADRNQPSRQPEKPPAAKMNLRFDSIEITPPNPTTTSELTARTNISPVGENNLEFQYAFWVNAEKIKDGPENRLGADQFKKGDYVYVDVIAQKKGKEIFRRRSEMTRILNTSPEIKGIEFPDIRGPGVYQIRVNARDADNDQLAYSLEGDKIPEGISIDPDTGIITCEFNENPPEKVKFFVVVSDNDQGQIKQEVSLSFHNPKKKEHSENL
jgi:hypothetical protein